MFTVWWFVLKFQQVLAYMHLSVSMRYVRTLVCRNVVFAREKATQYATTSVRRSVLLSVITCIAWAFRPSRSGWSGIHGLSSRIVVLIGVRDVVQTLYRRTGTQTHSRLAGKIFMIWIVWIWIIWFIVRLDWYSNLRWRIGNRNERNHPWNRDNKVQPRTVSPQTPACPFVCLHVRP